MPQLPPVQVPPVTLPPVQLPAPLPDVAPPPPVTAPEVRVEVPQVTLPQAPAVRVPAAPAPSPSPPPATPRVAAPAPAARTGPAAPSSGQAPSGATAAPAGTTSAPPARSRAARVAALRGARGVLGTSFRSRRQLVRALSACVAGLPGRQERLLVMRYGVGSAAAHPDRAVASALGLSRGQYASVRARALRGLVRDARAGGCRDATPSSAAPAIAFGDGGELRPVAAGAASGSSPSRGEIAVRGERASGGSELPDPDGDGLATPLAVDAVEAEGSLLGLLMLAAALALLAVIGVRALRARVKR